MCYLLYVVRNSLDECLGLGNNFKNEWPRQKRWSSGEKVRGADFEISHRAHVYLSPSLIVGLLQNNVEKTDEHLPGYRFMVECHWLNHYCEIKNYVKEKDRKIINIDQEF